MRKKFGVNVKRLNGDFAVQKGAGTVFIIKPAVALEQVREEVGKVDIYLLVGRDRRNADVHVVFLNDRQNIDKVIPGIGKFYIKFLQNIFPVKHYMKVLGFRQPVYAAVEGKRYNHVGV